MPQGTFRRQIPSLFPWEVENSDLILLYSLTIAAIVISCVSFPLLGLKLGLCEHNIRDATTRHLSPPPVASIFRRRYE
jgi:hypothetical protein